VGHRRWPRPIRWRPKSDWRFSVPKPDGLEPVFTYDKNYYWNIETSWGILKIKLYPFVAPNHVTNAIYLTRLELYDDLTFHRAITGFMVQGGDPARTGAGSLTNYSPGLEGECSLAAIHSKRGILSTANSGEGTDSSQFFITYAATSWLDGSHTVFGEVVDGFPALDALEARSTASPGTPTETLTIISATITVE
jgi:cyclophilin family peptidyl-prolyl cis-trans isomerase